MTVVTALRRGGRVSGEVRRPEGGGEADPPKTWLLAVAARRDREAFARLHEHFAPRLAGFLARSGTADVEELVQETMLTVWRKAELYDPTQAGASTWIFTIARNLRIDALRRGGRATLVDIDGHDEIDDTSGAETTMIATERDRRVRAALAELPPDQAEAVRLAYYSEKSQSEIAADLGIPLGTVKSRLRLAAARLRSMLEGER